MINPYEEMAKDIVKQLPPVMQIEKAKVYALLAIAWEIRHRPFTDQTEER